MHKLFLHLFIACTTFFSSLGLTKLIRDSSTEASMPPQSVQLVNIADTTVGIRVTDDEQKLLEIYRQYGPAKTIHERAFFEQVESKNYMLFLRDRNMTREENIRWMQSWPNDVVYEYDVESIRIVGDAAVVTGRMRARYRNGTGGSCGFIDVLVRNGSTWKILSTTSVDC
jgi:Domain of unknown function (DUF4440)